MFRWVFGMGFLYILTCGLGIYILSQFNRFANMNIVDLFYIVAPVIVVLFGIVHMLQYKKDYRALYSGIFIITFGGIFSYTSIMVNVYGRDEGRIMGSVFGGIGILFWPLFSIGILYFIVKLIKEK